MPNTTVAHPLDLSSYEIAGVSRVLTPALAIYMDVVDSNIQVMLDLLGGDAERWRPHIKTAKLAKVMERMIARGVRYFKCATTLELLTLCKLGAPDVLVAYPSVGERGRRVREIAAEFSNVRVSALVDSTHDLAHWKGSSVDLFIDINPGMDRTGIGQMNEGGIVGLAKSIKQAGIRFRGLHYYDGHHREPDLNERTRAAHAGYDQLIKLVRALEKHEVRVEEVITCGTPALPCSLSYTGFHDQRFIHRLSPGTIIYGDMTSATQLPKEWAFRPAALVITAIVSQPANNTVTCDAGHKTVSVDSGVPNCGVLGHPELEPLSPSEEHLPLGYEGAEPPTVGSILYLVPRHVCPTVNNFDHALIVQKGRIASIAEVTARGRETPIR